jgi:Pin2-interacting protein X1
MKGLGFDRAMKDDEITGLDIFTDLLSRLNGKSEEAVEEQKRARLVVKTNRFVEQRYGPMRFVRGGLLEGDKLKSNDNAPKETKEADSKPTSDAGSGKDKKSSKKRKVESIDEGDDSTPSVTEPETKKKRKKDEKKSSKKPTDDTASTTETDSKAKRKEKKKSKKDGSAKNTKTGDIVTLLSNEASTTDQADDTLPEKSKKSKEERKEEKRLKKLKKEDKKEEKRRKKAEAEAQKFADSSSSSKSSSPKPAGTDAKTTAEPTPAASGTSTPRGNALFTRSRFLKAKREAMVDSNAINKVGAPLLFCRIAILTAALQIFMVKT